MDEKFTSINDCHQDICKVTIGTTITILVECEQQRWHNIEGDLKIIRNVASRHVTRSLTQE